jgi:hypothetical protein
MHHTGIQLETLTFGIYYLRRHYLAVPAECPPSYRPDYRRCPGPSFLCFVSFNNTIPHSSEFEAGLFGCPVVQADEIFGHFFLLGHLMSHHYLFSLNEGANFFRSTIFKIQPPPKHTQKSCVPLAYLVSQERVI